MEDGTWKEKSSDHLAAWPLAASSKHKSSTLRPWHRGACLGCPYRTHGINRTSHHRNATLRLVFLSYFSFTMGGIELFTTTRHYTVIYRLRVPLELFFSSTSLVARLETLYSCWLYFCFNWGCVSPMPVQHSFFSFGVYVNHDFPMLLPQANDEKEMMVPSLSVLSYTSPSDSHCPFRKSLLWLQVTGISWKPSVCQLAARQHATIMLCISFHHFSCCCPLYSQAAPTVLSLSCKLSTLLLEQLAVIRVTVSTAGFIGALRILKTSLGSPSPRITVIWEHLNLIL